MLLRLLDHQLRPFTVYSSNTTRRNCNHHWMGEHKLGYSIQKRTMCSYVWTTCAWVWNRFVQERQPEKARNLFQELSKFPPTDQLLGITKCCPGRKAYVFMGQCLRMPPWPAWWPKMGKISLYWLSYKLYMGWCFKSWPPYCMLWKYTAYVSHIYIYIKYKPTCPS